MLGVFTPLQKAPVCKVRVLLTLTWILKCTAEQLKKLHDQMQKLKLCRQHSPPHKPMHCWLPPGVPAAAAPGPHTQLGKDPTCLAEISSTCTLIHYQTEQQYLQLFLRKVRSHSTLCALETCPCCECALRWRGWGAGAGAGGCSQLLGLLLPSWAQGWWAGCRTWAFAIWHANLGKNCCSYLPLVWNMWGCWGERNSDGEHCVASATPPVLTEAWSTAREAEECRSKQNNKEFRK